MSWSNWKIDGLIALCVKSICVWAVSALIWIAGVGAFMFVPDRVCQPIFQHGDELKMEGLKKTVYVIFLNAKHDIPTCGVDGEPLMPPTEYLYGMSYDDYLAVTRYVWCIDALLPTRERDDAMAKGWPRVDSLAVARQMKYGTLTWERMERAYQGLGCGVLREKPGNN